MIRLARVLIVSAFLALTLAGGAAAQVFDVPVGAAGSFLHADPTDNPPGPTVVDLASLGLPPGSVVRLRARGDWHNGPGADIHFYQFAVFSSSTTLLPKTERHRVPGAIDIGLRYFSGFTCPYGDTMDIVEDFRVDTTGIVVTIPVGGAFLFTMPHDCFSMDNYDPDGDCALRIEVISLAGVEGVAAARAPIARPNPFRAATAVRFSLAQPGPVNLAVFDVTGRRLRALASGEWAAGEHEVRWDGLDAAGRAVPRGAYFVRIEDALGSRTVRVSAIR